jgi:hypothetical protein
MSTSVAISELVSELDELIVPEREEPEFFRWPQSRWDVSILPKEPDDEPEAPAKERKIPERVPNLGASILLQAIEDYLGGDEREHRSAALFLFPKTKKYADHLSWAIGLTNLALYPTRRRLEELRPLWDAARQKE